MRALAAVVAFMLCWTTAVAGELPLLLGVMRDKEVDRMLDAFRFFFSSDQHEPTFIGCSAGRGTKEK